MGFGRGMGSCTQRLRSTKLSAECEGGFAERRDSHPAIMERNR